MFQKRTLWPAVAIGLLSVGVAGAALYVTRPVQPRPADNPWRRMPEPQPHVDHTNLITGELKAGPDVTRACLECHPDAAKEVMQTAHWTWLGDQAVLPSGEVVEVGKRNVINNFCVHALPNIRECSACHAGYGWEDEHYTFDEETNVDCLVCHDQSNTYAKGEGGYPKPDVDLVAAAQSVGLPTRINCGGCHFSGAGGDGVKHGDLDSTLYYPTERIDVHMGRYDFQCITCHRTEHHQIAGSSMQLSSEPRPQVACTNCHSSQPHGNQRLDSHTDRVACETCHIPRMALDVPTQTYWDWSQAGEDRGINDRFVYLKKKGSFEYAQNIPPEFRWYNGCAEQYLTGEKIDPDGPVYINRPLGGPRDANAKIAPFKVHYQKQPYDTENLVLLTPKTVGPGGYWTEFDWDKALRLGCEVTGVPYSGHFDFVETEMYRPIHHMVQPAEKALQCDDCHGPGGRMDWESLGYDGDPAFRGDRRQLGYWHETAGGK